MSWSVASILLWLKAPSCKYCTHMSVLLFTELTQDLTEVANSATHFSVRLSDEAAMDLSSFKWLMPKVWQVPSLTVQPKGFFWEALCKHGAQPIRALMWPQRFVSERKSKQVSWRYCEHGTTLHGRGLLGRYGLEGQTWERWRLPSISFLSGNSSRNPSPCYSSQIFVKRLGQQHLILALQSIISFLKVKSALWF